MPYSYGFTAGLATFGLAMPAGEAPDSVLVGSVPTQCNRKTSWPDGTWRFGVVTARIPSTGTYVIAPAASLGGTPFSGEWPTATVTFTIAGVAYVAMLPAHASSTDIWLTGVLVDERRAVIVPKAGAVAHPLLQVIFDVRAYAAGGYRVDITGQNTRDVATANQFMYDLAISINGQTVYTKAGCVHQWLKRWRKKFSIGLVESQITPDFESAYAAKMLPRYLASVPNRTYTYMGDAWDILQYGPAYGDMLSAMPQGGERPEIAPYPNWAAQYLVNKTQNLKAAMLARADLSGSWSGHLSEPDNTDGVSIVRLDRGVQPARGGYWFDGRWRDGGTDGPKNDGNGTGERIQAPHSYSLSYVPYMVTGDRFYSDTLKFWANQHLLQTYPGAALSPVPGTHVDFGRQGGKALFAPYANEPRGFGWGMRDLVDAWAGCPDSDPDKAYFAQRVQNNLDWLDTYSRTSDGGFLPATFWEDTPPSLSTRPWDPTWHMTILAWALDHCADMGFTPTKAMRDRLVRQHITVLSNPAIIPQQVGAALYYPYVGDESGKLYATLAQFAAAQNPSSGYVIGYYGAYIRILIMMGVRDGLPNADVAMQWINTFRQNNTSIEEDAAMRSGWALAPFGASQPEPPPSDPPPPVDPPAPPVTRVLVSTLTATLDQPDTVTPFTFVQPVKDAAPALQPHIRPSYKETPQPRAVGEEFTMTAIAFNVGAGRATGVRENTGLNPALTVVSHEGGADYDPASGWWEIGTVESSTQKELPMRVKVKE